MRLSFTQAFALALVTIMCFACEKEELPQATFQTVPSTQDETFTAFSQVLSYAVRTNPDLRAFLKATALEQIDGDYSVFYPIARHLEVLPGTTFAEVLTKAAADGALMKETDAEAFFQTAAVDRISDLNILIPEYENFMPEDWDTKSSIPYVAYFTSSLNDVVDEYISAYDDQGRNASLAIKTSPDVRVLVVGNSERILPANEAYQNVYNFRQIARLDSVIYYKIESFNQSEDQPYDNSHSNRFDKNSCDRDDRANREELIGFQYANDGAMSYSCPWIEGRCEFDIHAAWTENPSSPYANTLRKFIDDRRKYFKRQHFYNIRNQTGSPLLFFRWKLDRIADNAKYVFVERDKKDWNGKITIDLPSATFKLPGGSEITSTKVSIEVGYNEQDEELGEDLIYYCDEADGNGLEYFTGRVKFRVTEAY